MLGFSVPLYQFKQNSLLGLLGALKGLIPRTNKWLQESF